MAHQHVTYLRAVPDPAGSEVGTATRELDSRISDGIHVRLLWGPSDGHVSVSVSDVKTGDAFELPVPDGAEPLDVFRHPFAYAA